MTNVGFNPELVQRKVAPPLEVVTHGGRNWKRCVLEFVALEIHQRDGVCTRVHSVHVHSRECSWHK